MSASGCDGGEDGSNGTDTEVECQNCGYIWMYSGEMWNATCPRCGRKTRTPFHEETDNGTD